MRELLRLCHAANGSRDERLISAKLWQMMVACLLLRLKAKVKKWAQTQVFREGVMSYCLQAVSGVCAAATVAQC